MARFSRLFLQQQNHNFVISYDINNDFKAFKAKDKLNENGEDIKDKLQAINDTANKSEITSISSSLNGRRDQLIADNISFESRQNEAVRPSVNCIEIDADKLIF